MRQAKGSLFAMVVKSIKANVNKKSEFNELLSEKAKEYLNRRTLSASWYPFDIYKEFFDAVCLVEARNNPKILNKWGRIEGKRSLTTIYKATTFENDLQIAIEKISRLHRLLFNFGEARAEIISDHELAFTWFDFVKVWENFYHVTVGWAQTYIELSINKKTDYFFLNKSWKSKDWTKIKISWTP